MFQGPEDLRSALTQLGERLRFAEAPQTTILVAGGAALTFLGLARATTTTKDIDIVAILKRSGGQLQYHRAEPLPAYLKDAIAQTATDLGLSDDWINTGPTSLVDFGLPAGCLDRAVPVEFGEKLIVYFVGRLDQIHFKLYAAVDQGGGRHLVDLLTLEPAPDELLQAAKWSMSHDPSEEYRLVLRRFLSDMGQADVANQL